MEAAPTLSRALRVASSKRLSQPEFRRPASRPRARPPDVPRFVVEVLHGDMPSAGHNADFRARGRNFVASPAAVDDAGARGIELGTGSAPDFWRVRSERFLDTSERYFEWKRPGSTMDHVAASAEALLAPEAERSVVNIGVVRAGCREADQRARSSREMAERTSRSLSISPAMALRSGASSSPWSALTLRRTAALLAKLVAIGYDWLYTSLSASDRATIRAPPAPTLYGGRARRGAELF